jgi:hypothetical protein
MLIDGKWMEAASGKRFESRNPATGELLATVAEGNAEDINRAVAAARTAFEGPWSKFKPYERQQVLLRPADLVERHFDELSSLDTLDMGAPISRTFKQVAHRAGLSEKVIDAIVGHAPASVGRAYGEPTLQDKAAALAKFPRKTPAPWDGGPPASGGNRSAFPSSAEASLHVGADVFVKRLDVCHKCHSRSQSPNQRTRRLVAGVSEMGQQGTHALQQKRLGSRAVEPAPQRCAPAMLSLGIEALVLAAPERPSNHLGSQRAPSRPGGNSGGGQRV